MGSWCLAFLLQTKERTPTWRVDAAAFIFCLLVSVFSSSKGRKREKAFKMSVTSEAFCGSLQNGGFVPFESPHNPCCLCTVCETSLGFKQTWGWPLRQSHCHSLEETLASYSTSLLTSKPCFFQSYRHSREETWWVAPTTFVSWEPCGRLAVCKVVGLNDGQCWNDCGSLRFKPS